MMAREEEFKDAFRVFLEEWDAEMHVEDGETFVQFNSGDADYIYFTDADKDFVGIDT
jgi:hypothetical protein